MLALEQQPLFKRRAVVERKAFKKRPAIEHGGPFQRRRCGQVRAAEGISQDPSAVSDASGPGYKSIERSIRQIFPDAIVAPSLVLGATDSRYYQGLADGVYRFSPQRTRDEDRARIHGTNERLSVKNFGEAVRFYAQLIKNGDAL